MVSFSCKTEKIATAATPEILHCKVSNNNIKEQIFVQKNGENVLKNI